MVVRCPGLYIQLVTASRIFSETSESAVIAWYPSLARMQYFDPQTFSPLTCPPPARLYLM